MEVDLDLFMIVGVLEGTAVVIRFDKGLVTTRLRVATFALLVDSVGGWMGTGEPPIQRQIHTEVHQVLMLSFLGGRGWRLGGLPLIGGFWHGQEHTGVVGHGCCDPAGFGTWDVFEILVTVTIRTPVAFIWPGLGVTDTLVPFICSITDDGKGISVISNRPSIKEIVTLWRWKEKQYDRVHQIRSDSLQTEGNTKVSASRKIWAHLLRQIDLWRIYNAGLGMHERQFRLALSLQTYG